MTKAGVGTGVPTISEGDALKETYHYDELNELTREDNVYQNKTITYSYDAGGNITAKTEYAYTTGTPGTPTATHTYTYGDTNWKDKLTAYDGAAVTYDAIGNPLSYLGGLSFTWQNGRQLATANKTGTSVSYKYNDSSIRTQKTVNGVTTNYYLNGDSVVTEITGSSRLDYFYDENGNLFGFNYNGASYYYLRNGQNDIIGILDANRTQVVTYSYDTWGKLLGISGSLASTVGTTNPYRYRGYRYDTETGLYYVSSRYYDPNIGRWINADSHIAGVGGDIRGCNLFSYCMNNPVNMSDPTGHWPRWITAAVACVAIIVAVVASPAIAAVAATVAVVALVALVVQTVHYGARKAANSKLPANSTAANDSGWKASNDPVNPGPKADLHQYSSKDKSNVKYVSPDGHKEIIFDKLDAPVLDPRDIGTYNFCPSDNGPWYDDANIGHGFFDILPWVIFGNNDDDPGPLINIFS